MACLVLRIQIILVIGVGQEIREIIHYGLYHAVGIQPGLVSLLSILRKKSFFCNHFPDLGKQVLTGMYIIHMGKPTIVIQSEVYRIQILPATS